MKARITVFGIVVFSCFMFFSLSMKVEAKTIENGTTIETISTADSFDAEQAITYGRVVCLKNSGTNNGTLIATCDQHKWVNGEQVWPIYRSTDNGESWSLVSNVTDTVFSTNRKAQPMLYELPQAVGNMPAGTLLLAGNLVPNDKSSSRIVIYKSTDVGATWEYVSTVDIGGAFNYDRSPESTTSTIWEPFLYMDNNNLVCAFSDERQKSNNVLQALSLRYTSDGINWSTERNITAIGNSNDRPGMVTVSKMKNGKFIATYEVVNKPSYTQNSSVVYYKISDDGINWNENSLGTLLQTSDGQCLGSSPYVKFVDAGGPNGMVIVGSKWVVNSSGDVQEGGQNFFVNYNYGVGSWERYPQALTWNGEDVTYLDAFSQCIETNVDNTVLYQIANIGNSTSNTNSLKIGTLPLTMSVYEAENANITNASIVNCEDSSNKKEVGYINYSDSAITFNHVYAPTSGNYKVYVRYNNGGSSTSIQNITINNGTTNTITYPITPNWHQYFWAEKDCSLRAGMNSVKLGFNTGYAEIDCIAICKNGNDLSRKFMLENRNSQKYLEVPDMNVVSGTSLQQYDKTYYPCQVWNIIGTGNLTLTNINSQLRLDISAGSTANGALAIQNTQTDSNSQKWQMVQSTNGYFYLKNVNSLKYLEVQGNQSSNGASVGQWESTGYLCQEWQLIKEGIQ